MTHCICRQARLMVFPVSMNGCIICSLPVLVLYPTLVVRSSGRHTLYLQTRTHSSPMHVHTMKAMSREAVDVRTFRGVKFFFSTQPQTARLSPSYGSLIYGSKPDSGKLIELALALDSCPWGPGQQTLFFPSGWVFRPPGAGYSYDSLTRSLSFRGPENGCLKTYSTLQSCARPLRQAPDHSVRKDARLSEFGRNQAIGFIASFE